MALKCLWKESHLFSDQFDTKIIVEYDTVVKLRLIKRNEVHKNIGYFHANFEQNWNFLCVFRNKFTKVNLSIGRQINHSLGHHVIEYWPSSLSIFAVILTLPWQPKSPKIWLFCCKIVINCVHLHTTNIGKNLETLTSNNLISQSLEKLQITFNIQFLMVNNPNIPLFVIFHPFLKDFSCFLWCSTKH